MTGWGSLDVAIEAMRYGVRDFVQKPWDDAQLVARLSAEIERSREPSGAGRGTPDSAHADAGHAPPHIDGFELAACWQPAGRVGGDCYDAIPLGGSRMAITIADVVGGRSRGAPDVRSANRRARVRDRRDADRRTLLRASTGSSVLKSPRAASSASSAACSTRRSASCPTRMPDTIRAYSCGATARSNGSRSAVPC